jgi:hypothetical protein
LDHHNPAWLVRSPPFLSTLWVGAQQAGTGIGPQPTINLGNYQAAEIVDGAWRAYGPGSCPRAWCKSGGLVTVISGKPRLISFP